MKAIVQRVKDASCVVDNKTVGKCEFGFLLLIGITHDDTFYDVLYIAKKVASLRIFSDEFGKMNKSLKDVSGSILSISQFTLYADVKHGNRPSFTLAAKPDLANELYEMLNFELEKKYLLHVEKGIFGADMQINFTNVGPVTIIIDSKEK